MVALGSGFEVDGVAATKVVQLAWLYHWATALHPSLAAQRCDSFSYFRNTTAGCAYYQFQYYAFTVSMSDPLVAEAAQLDYQGQQEISTHPGAFGLGAPLTRDTNSTDQKANRKASCGTISANNHNSTLSCDEYPYATTHQGAAFGPFVSGLINAAQNSKEGSYLSAFYLYNRVAEGDPFYVLVTP